MLPGTVTLDALVSITNPGGRNAGPPPDPALIHAQDGVAGTRMRPELAIRGRYHHPSWYLRRSGPQTRRSVVALSTTAPAVYDRGMTVSDDIRPLKARDERLGPWRAFLLAHARVTRRLDEELRSEHGLSLGEYDALLALAEAPDHRLRMHALAERVILSKTA